MEEVLQLKIDGKFNGKDATLSISLDAESAFEIEDVEADAEVEETDEQPRVDSTEPQEAKAPTEPTTPESVEETAAPESTEAEETTAEPEEPDTPETPAEEAQTVEGDASVSASHPMQAEPLPEDEAEEDEGDEEKEYDTDIPTEVQEKMDEADAEEEAEAEAEEDEAEEVEVPSLNADTKQFSVAKKVLDADGEWVRVRTITDQLQDEEGADEWNDSKATSHLYSVMDKGIVERKKDDSSGKYVYHITDLGKKAIEQALKDAERWDSEAKAAA